MTSSTRRASVLVEALRAAFDGDHGALGRLLTEDVRVWAPLRSVSSLGELVAELERRDDAFTDAVADVVPLEVGGDYACAEWTVAMTHTGTLEVPGGAVIEPTGVRVVIHGASVAEFRGEQICSLRQYWDELPALEEICSVAGRPLEPASSSGDPSAGGGASSS
jgi:ketosteroid isomerase-like protein